MIVFFLICAINEVFLSVSFRNEILQSPNHQFEKSLIIDTKDENDHFPNYVQDFDDNYYQDQHSSRKLFNWINNIIRSNTSDEINLKTTESKYDVLDDRIRLHNIESNLTETLTQLSNVLTEILNIIKYTRQKEFKSLHNVIQTTDFIKDRFKRDTNKTANEETQKMNDTKELIDNERDNATNDKELERNGRRMMTDVNPIVNSEVKERLLYYINEGFDDIKSKISSLERTKDVYSKDVNFRIGYIIASLDSLDANMKNLKLDMNRNKFVWNDKKILNLYDIVKTSNNAVGNLLETLKSYINTTLK